MVREHSILFVTKGEKASSTRYRVSGYLPFWRRAGWHAEHLTHDGSWRAWWSILARARRVDTVVILRRTFGFPWLRLLRRAARRLVFDFDDAIFVRGSGERSTSKYARFGRTVAACDLVWAGNRYLAEHASRFNARVVVVPTAVDAEKYAVSPPKPDDSIDLVWIGSGATRKHLQTAVPALQRAAARVPRLRLKIVADFSLDADGLTVEPVQWTAQGEAVALAASHIGIAPLPDNPFTRGKCGLKILQYMAAGLPVIASPVGINAELVHDGVSGYTAVGDDGWVAAIERLATDPPLRRRLGEQAREVCRRHYTVERVFERLNDSLSDTHA